MLDTSTILGQDRAIAQLCRAIDADRVAHAYLFTGPARCGKYTTGLALAAALNCLEAPGRGCGTCASCERIAAGIHPDVQTLERQGAAQIIPIAVIRERVIPQLGLPPHEGRARVFLIEEATSLPDASANALLKTLEEPPNRTHFILCTTAPENLLPTIRSRCQRVDFAALRADIRARLSGDEPEAAEHLERLTDSLYQAAAARDSASLHEVAREVASDRKNLDPVLELFSERLYREARSAAVTHELATAARLGRQAMRVLDTRKAVAQNAHGQTALEALLHELRLTF